jgi:hypothetical protein
MLRPTERGCGMPGIGQCGRVCSNGQFPSTSLQAHKLLPQREINKREFQPHIEDMAA